MNECVNYRYASLIISLVPSIVTKDDKGEYIQSLVESREHDDSSITQNVMLRHHIANLKQRVLQYQGDDGRNDGVNKESDGVKHLNNTLQRVYQAIVNKPEIRSTDLMSILNISESTVTRSTREFKKLGFIKREVSDKTGRWVILK